MAQKTITDGGNGKTRIAITRELDGAGVAVFSASVLIYTSDGKHAHQSLDSAELAALIPAGATRTAFLARLNEIYQAALAKEGFV